MRIVAGALLRCHGEGVGVTGVRVPERDHLIRAYQGGQSSRQRRGLGIQNDHGVDVLILGQGGREHERAGGPHGNQLFDELFRRAQVRRAHPARTQHVPQIASGHGPAPDAVFPAGCEFVGQPGGRGGNMGGIRTPEGGLGAAQFMPVGHRHEIITADHCLEDGLPPGQLQLTTHLVGGNSPVLHVLQELTQPARTQVVQEHGPLRQGGQVRLVIDEFVQHGFQLLHVRGFQRGRGGRALQGDRETFQVLGEPPLNVTDLAGSLGHRRLLQGGGPGAPAVPFGLHLDQRGMQIRDVHPRAHVLLGGLTQPRALQAGHFDPVIPTPPRGSGRGNQVGHGTVVNVRGEMLERIAHLDHQ